MHMYSLCNVLLTQHLLLTIISTDYEMCKLYVMENILDPKFMTLFSLVNPYNLTYQT
jgi:hypothetical protein